MVYKSSLDYLYRRNGIYYFTRNVSSDLKTRFNKSRVVVSLHTRSIMKAQKSALALCDRLDRYFESLRLERFHSQESDIANPNHFAGIFIPEDNAAGERLPVPHITLRKHPGRHLKTASSEANIPLVGSVYK